MAAPIPTSYKLIRWCICFDVPLRVKLLRRRCHNEDAANLLEFAQAYNAPLPRCQRFGGEGGERNALVLFETNENDAPTKPPADYRGAKCLDEPGRGGASKEDEVGVFEVMEFVFYAVVVDRARPVIDVG